MKSLLEALVILSVLYVTAIDMTARKVRQSLKITSEKEKSVAGENDFSDDKWQKLSATDTTCVATVDSVVIFYPDSITFAGYEKEINSSHESLLVVNNSNLGISGIELKIVYKDLNDRMLHTRTLTHNCIVPPKETRKIYFKSWDMQKTHFYYLGNEPRKVATPYKIEIVPLAFFTEY